MGDVTRGIVPGQPLAFRHGLPRRRQLRGGRVVEGSLYYHYARLIEDLYAIRAYYVQLYGEVNKPPVLTRKDLAGGTAGVVV